MCAGAMLSELGWFLIYDQSLDVIKNVNKLIDVVWGEQCPSTATPHAQSWTSGQWGDPWTHATPRLCEAPANKFRSDSQHLNENLWTRSPQHPVHLNSD